MGIGAVEFVERPDVRPRFDAVFPNPGRQVESKLKAPAISDRHQLVGTAFDYYCNVLLCYKQDAPSPFEPFYGSLETESVEEVVRSAFGTIEDFIEKGNETSELFRSLLTVVQYHNFGELRRQHYVESKYRRNDDPPDLPSDEKIGEFTEAEVEDLERMASVMADTDFLSTGNEIKRWPAFNWREDIMSGYGDLLIDGTLFDIKTTIKPVWKSSYWRQLLSYYLINDMHRKLKQADFYNSYNEPGSAYSIEELGVYFARYGACKTVPIEIFTNQKTKYENFRAWFVEKAIEINGDKHRNYDDLREILCDQYSYQRQSALIDF